MAPAKNLRKLLRAILAAAEIEHWPQDAPRRIYASNWLAVNHDVNRLNNLDGSHFARNALAALSQSCDAEKCGRVLED
jgi:hypothetical protein